MLNDDEFNLLVKAFDRNRRELIDTRQKFEELKKENRRLRDLLLCDDKNSEGY